MYPSIMQSRKIRKKLALYIFLWLTISLSHLHPVFVILPGNLKLCTTPSLLINPLRNSRGSPTTHEGSAISVDTKFYASQLPRNGSRFYFPSFSSSLSLSTSLLPSSISLSLSPAMKIRLNYLSYRWIIEVPKITVGITKLVTSNNL